MPARSADTHKGAQLYATYCASCHGADGRGATPGTPDLARGPALLKPDAQIAERIKAGRGAMPAFFGILRERELFDVIAYLRTLR